MPLKPADTSADGRPTPLFDREGDFAVGLVVDDKLLLGERFTSLIEAVERVRLLRQSAPYIVVDAGEAHP